jgi:hypothetical protein
MSTQVHHTLPPPQPGINGPIFTTGGLGVVDIIETASPYLHCYRLPPPSVDPKYPIRVAVKPCNRQQGRNFKCVSFYSPKFSSMTEETSFYSLTGVSW